jgi:hypothetical protein
MSTSEIPPVLEPQNYIPLMETNGEQQTNAHKQLQIFFLTHVCECIRVYTLITQYCIGIKIFVTVRGK